MIGFGLTGYGQNFGVEGYYYEITSSTSPPPQVRVIGYDASLGTGVTIPTTVNHNGTDYDVTAIRKFSFDNEQLTRVTFTDTPGTPGKITSIGDNAFKHNQLDSVTIPNNVTSIGKHAFGNNPDLRLVELLGNSPPGIHQNTFWRRDQINLVVPKGKREDYLNKGCTGSRSITEVAQVDDEFTVDYITYRITDTDPNSRKVSVIDYNTAEGPTTVNIPSTIQYQEIDYAVASIGSYAFARTLRTDKLTSVIIPNGVKSIGVEAFRENLLSSVTIPNTVNSIEQDAFLGNELTEIIFSMSSNLTSIEGGVFKSNKLTSVTIPGGVTSIGNSAFSGNQLTVVTIPSSVTDIEQWAFANSTGKNINTIFVGAATPPSIEENTFGGRSE
ncbi:MAG: leucine-rich repeat domain-containing protein, partial [Chlorobiales bacterium]|nr:leucine-rich repeat domain-containing protein [Chlorobiales bacterium]